MKVLDILGNLFGYYRNSINTRNIAINVIGSSIATYDYVNTIKTDKKKARELYHNVNKTYALAAHLIKPIVDNNVNFIGKPKLYGNKKALNVIEDVKIDYGKVHKALEIDGDIFVWPQWNAKKECIELILVPIDAVHEIFIDPISKEVTGYHLRETVAYSTISEKNKSITIDYIITNEIVTVEISGNYADKKAIKNPFGKIPIIHFSNDRDINEQYGHCEFENIEPQLRFYHELTYEAGAAQSRDGHPKLKVTTSNPKTWIENNFGAGTWDRVTAGKQTLKIDDRDLFINAENDNVEYLYLNKTSGDFSKLADLTFKNVVEGSQTPEINFGANIGTSLASVKEYRPVWIKKIEAKQLERTAPWLETFNMILIIHNFVHLKNIKNDITITWQRPNFASIKEQTEILEGFSKAIEKLINKRVISKQEVYETLKKLDIFELLETFNTHQEVIDNEKVEEESNATDEETSDEEGNTSVETDESDETSNESVSA